MIDNFEVQMDSRKTNQTEYAQAAWAQAKTYETLGNIFNQRPDSSLVKNLKVTRLDSLIELDQRNDLNAEAQEGLSEISHFMKQIQKQAENEVELSLQIDWTRLFRGVQPGYGPLPPYEGLYIGENESNFKAQETVASFYNQYGVLPDERAGNRPDYIGLELDFLRYVCEQQAESWEKGDETLANYWQLAESDFLNNHLGRWVAGFCDQAINKAKTDFYRGFAHLTKGIIEEMASLPQPDFNGIN